MPKIPMPRQQVANRLVRNPRATAEDFGANTGKELVAHSLSQLGRVLQERGLKIQDEQNKSLAILAYQNLSEKQREYSGKVFDRKGHDAFGLTKEAQEKRKEFEGEVKEGLKTQDSVDLFMRMSSASSEAWLNNVARHEQAQLKEHSLSVVEGAKNLAYSNPSHIRAAQEAIYQNLQDKSESDLMAEDKAMQSMSYLSQVARLSAENPFEAQRYLEDVASAMDEPSQKRAKQAVSDGAEEHAYQLLNTNPRVLRDGLKSGVWNNVLSEKEKRSFLDKADKAIPKMDKRDRILKMANQSEGNEALWNKFEDGSLTTQDLLNARYRGVDEDFLNILRNMTLKKDPLSPLRQDENFTTLTERVMDLGIKARKTLPSDSETTMEDILRLQIEASEMAFRGEIKEGNLTSILRMMRRAKTSKVKAEQGHDDRGWDIFLGREPYDNGYQVIQNWLKETSQTDNSSLKSKMYSELVRRADELYAEDLSEEKRNELLENLARNIINPALKDEHPELQARAEGEDLPHAILNNEGLARTATGESNAKVDQMLKDVGDGQWLTLKDKDGRLSAIWVDKQGKPILDKDGRQKVRG